MLTVGLFFGAAFASFTAPIIIACVIHGKSLNIPILGLFACGVGLIALRIAL